jgi:hypothetical protein
VTRPPSTDARRRPHGHDKLKEGIIEGFSAALVKLETLLAKRLTPSTAARRRSMPSAPCASTSATTRSLSPACIPKPWTPTAASRHQPSLGELIHAGKESYFIVSQFNLFEYEQEAPLFARLSDRFERCILGLTLVREELRPRKPLMLPPN